MSARGVTRRALLGAGTGALGLRATGRAPVAADGRRLVVLQLFGGNDGLNTLVPIEDDDYHRARPTLRIPKGDALPLDELNGLHPRLARLHRRALDGQLTCVQRVGYARPNLSHFKSQDIWDAAVPDDRPPTSGWLGRMFDANVAGLAERDTAIGMLAVGFDTVPLALAAETFVAPALRELGRYRLREPKLARPGAGARQLEVLRELAQLPSADERLAFVARAHRTMERSIAELGRAAPPSSVAYPRSALGADLRTAARIVAGGLETAVLVVRQVGYDTHANQERRHDQLLGELDQALDAFLTDLEACGELERTLVLTTSEFGRRLAESGSSGSAGTDHGAASVALFAGGTSVGGIHGGQPRLADLDDAGNPRFALDFRSLYATVIERWFGGDAAAVLGERWRALEVLA